jgi:hypothetical protein
MLKYSTFRNFPFNEIDNDLNTKNPTSKYQSYFDNINTPLCTYSKDSTCKTNTYYLENLRILTNFYDEKRYAIKTNYKFTKNILQKMFKETDPSCDILEITENWLPMNVGKFNKDINEGISEWFVNLKEKVNFKELNHIGGYVNFLDDINNLHKINIIINQKVYDVIYYNNLKKGEPSYRDIYDYMIQYVNGMKKMDKEIKLFGLLKSTNYWIADLR